MKHDYLQVTNLKSRMIYDSRGVPTIEVDIVLDGQYFGRASVPSGASIGDMEAIELRDNNPKLFHGKGVTIVLSNIDNVIYPKIINNKFESCEKLDQFLINLDGTENKSKLGANAILAVSLAFAKAFAASSGLDFFASIEEKDNYIMPIPLMNLINGGAHANNNLSIQEFMIMPIGFDSFSRGLQAGSEIFNSLKKILNHRKYSTAVGDEGGFAPDLTSDVAALELLTEATIEAGYRPGHDIYFALDIAANNFYQGEEYKLGKETLTSAQLIDYYNHLIKEFPIISIEDPFAENDIQAWKDFSKQCRNKIQIVGDDLFVSNSKYLQQGIDWDIASAIIVKPNQIGTFTETLKTIRLARESCYGTILSHRSGETEDTLIVHLAVGTGSEQIKVGSISRTDRVIKYNEILRIEEKLGDRASFYGRKILDKFSLGNKVG